MISLELVQSVMLATWSLESSRRNRVPLITVNHSGRLDQVFPPYIIFTVLIYIPTHLGCPEKDIGKKRDLSLCLWDHSPLCDEKEHSISNERINRIYSNHCSRTFSSNCNRTSSSRQGVGIVESDGTDQS